MARVFTRKDRRGRSVYYIDYAAVHPDTGRRIRKKERVGYSRRQAEGALESRLTDLRRGRFDGIFPAATCSLVQIRGQYLKYAKLAKSPRTVTRDEGILDRLLIPAFADRSLDRIAAQDVESFRVNRKAAGRAPATINKEIQLLKHVITKAVEWGKVRVNLLAGVKVLKVPPGRVRYLELEEIPGLLEACPAWLRPIVTIAAHTGMRRGGIIRLTRANIDKKNRLLVTEQTKNGERKAVPMNATVWAEALGPTLNSFAPALVV